MNIQNVKVQDIKRFIPIINICFIWIKIETHAYAIEKSTSNFYAETSLQFSLYSKEIESLDKKIMNFPKSSYFLLSAPDTFNPRSKFGSSIPDMQSDYTNSSMYFLGWPSLNEKEQRKNKKRIRDILEKQFKEQAKITERKKKLQQSLEKKLKQLADQKTRKASEDKLKDEKEQRLIKLNEEKFAKNKQKEIARSQRKIERLKRKEELKKLARERRKNRSNNSLIEAKDTKVKFTRTSNNSGQINQTIESTTAFNLFNKDKINFITGYNTYQQFGIEPVQNIPIKLDWKHEIGDFTVSVTAGIDWFNSIPITPSFKANAKTSLKIPTKLGKSLLIAGEFDYGPYKFNAKTINNQIDYYRLRESLLWPIDKKTSFSSLSYVGGLSDGNTEFQTFNRLERKIGDFTVSGNLFFWSFQKDLSQSSGYFSPRDFLVYNLGLDWKGKITKNLSCKLSLSLGQQQFQGKISNSTNFQSLCTAIINKNIDFDFGYGISNSFSGANIGGTGTALTDTWTGELRIKF